MRTVCSKLAYRCHCTFQRFGQGVALTGGELLAMQVNPCTHRNSKLQAALTTRRTASIANALDDSFYKEAPEVAHYAAGVLIDQDEYRPLIQATLVGDVSRNRSKSPDCFVCAGDRRLLAQKEHPFGRWLQRLY